MREAGTTKRGVVAAAILFVACTYLAFITPQVNQFTLVSSTTSSSSGGAAAVEFEGASEFLSLLRAAHRKKIIASPLPHCRRYDAITNEKDMKIRKYNRAVEIDWIGRNISSVEPSWSDAGTASCRFVALEFPPTEGTVHAALQQKTYISAFHTADQCETGFQWEADKPYTCLGNNFGGTLGAGSKEGCIDESAMGYLSMMWNEQNSNNDVFRCLNNFLQSDKKCRRKFDMNQVKATFANLTKTNYLHQFGYGAAAGVDWNAQIFVQLSKEVLSKAAKSPESIGIAIPRLIGKLKNETTALTKCVQKLLPPMIGANHTPEEERMWRERGVHLSTSTMQELPSSLLRSFPGSLHGVLPPPPTAIYSVNAILGTVINVPDETYYPRCTAYWNAVSEQAFKETKEEAEREGSLFGHLAKTPHILRNRIITTCATDESKCPFQIYDLVIDVTQVYCAGFFHWTIESWPRLAPFLDGLLADGMPNFAIRIGCDSELQEFHPQSYELVGLGNVTLLGHEPTVFAKEVVAPTEGFSHSPLLNFWNLVAVRQKVLARLGPVIERPGNKTVLVVIRDASRRDDTRIYNEQFLKDLKDGLPHNYNVVPYRSSDDRTMSCLECQVRAFMVADVIIGSHGAGLSHVLFAPKGALILERIKDEGNSGIYSELPFMLGMKYFPMWSDADARAYRDMIIFADGYS